MVDIKAFRGYRYNKNIVDVNKAVMPPYDVIDNNLKARLSSYSMNFIHLNLNSSHKNAKEIFDDWITRNILVQDEQDSLYAYQHEYTVSKKKYKRTGFISLIRLEELGRNILPHEETFDRHIDERLSLMEHLEADLGIIFMIYDDKNKVADKLIAGFTSRPEDMSCLDFDNCIHRLWKISDSAAINGVSSALKSKKAIIADGHHRYKTALKYSLSHRENAEAKYAMVSLVNSFNEGLSILPTNRLLGNAKIDIKDFGACFNLTEIEGFDESKLMPKSFILAVNRKYFLLSLKDEKILNDLFSGDESIYCSLDVAILHKLVFGKLLGIGKDAVSEIGFIKGNDAAVKDAEGGKTVFFVRPPSLAATFDIASHGKLMPQKSTYFYPKMFSGFVVHKL